MKEIVAIIRMNMMNQTKRALSDAGISSFTATGRVAGRGKGQVDFHILYGAAEGYEEAISQLGKGPRLIPKRLLYIVVPDKLVKTVMLETTGNRCIMVAEADSHIIGMCTAQLLVSTAEGGMAALIEDMVVDMEYRRQGIGKHLLAAITDWAVRQGATRLELFADCDNAPALEFYRKLNWRTTRLICLHKKHCAIS